jgi:hypothetical protein
VSHPEERRYIEVENRMLRRVFGPKGGIDKGWKSSIMRS